MDLQQYFREIKSFIRDRQFHKLKSVPLQKPDTFNWVTDIFEGINLQEHAQETALLWTDGRKEIRYSFEEMSQRANQLLNLLRAKGLQQHDIILLQLPLLPANWIIYLAAIKGGFRLIPAATILGVQDIVYRFGKLMPKAVFADTDNLGKIDEAEELSGKEVELKIVVDGRQEGWLPFEELENCPTEAEPAETKPEDPLFLFFTSGTTGMPKVVVHTHLSYPLGHLTTASWIGLRPGDIHYNISQPGWAKFAWSSFFAPWNMGATIFAFHQPGRFHAKEQLQLMEAHKISTFCAPPTALRMLIQENLKQYRFSFRECVAAGEPLNPEVIEIWKRGTGITLRDGYGQTEATAMVANLPDTPPRFGSMGKPTFLYDIIIADDEGNEMPLHEEGNICIRTGSETLNGIFSTYLDDEQKMKDVFRHGLYYTGDKAYQDEDGYIWFVGRDDDVIKASDYRIGPFEVESTLIQHEAVVEAAVVGSPHPIKGYEVKAFVIIHPTYEPHRQLAEELYAFARKNLAPYKAPRIIEFVEELPKTISGKIRRVELRAREAQKKAQKEQGEWEFFFS